MLSVFSHIPRCCDSFQPADDICLIAVFSLQKSVAAPPIPADVVMPDRPKNQFLRRAKGVGKRSLLQDQLRLQQQQANSACGSASSSSSKAGEQVTDSQQQQQRQRVVAFGAATFKKALRGWSGVPGKRLCHRLQQRLPVILVDEFRTSQISCVTLDKLRDTYYRKPGETQLTLCWSLKEYEVHSDNGRVFKGLSDRNRNAAANIRDLLAYWLVHHERPVQFRNEKRQQQTKTKRPPRKKQKTASNNSSAGASSSSTPAASVPPKRILSRRIPRA